MKKLKKIAVTGGTGFLGQATVRLAEERGHDVWAFDQSLGNDVLGYLNALEGADVIIHLAGVLGTSELFDTPEYAIDVNVKGALRILDWCRFNGAGYVGITMLPVFPSVYTATKICAQNLAEAWNKAYGIPVSCVRAFNAFGPHQAYGVGHPQKIVPTFSKLAWENKPLPVWGDGSQTMDLIHVDDVARILLDATEFGDGELFEAGTGTQVTVQELAEFVIDYTGSTGGIEYLPMRIGEEPTDIVSTAKGLDLLGYKPSLDWSKMKETIDWYKTNG